MHNDSSKSRWVSAFSHACMLVAVGVLAANAWAAAPKRPNILFLFTDDQPYRCLHCLGNEQIQTPNMDQLARDGVLFTNSFVTTSICCSNRACLLTGQHMARNGIRDFKTPLSAAAFAQTYPRCYGRPDTAPATSANSPSVNQVPRCAGSRCRMINSTSGTGFRSRSTSNRSSMESHAT